nr:unnamed protein product [Callosobruchus analis]CAI5855842.1 unnamed protein product [Callosobruchus analis]CAI5859922.1 unnamed protein product [Callosobruchus analis]CAI5869836.1 unnamed protein product [Callosobruchus analis]CAI5870482.1 unnamed protein product [Callosobruchus analis]
MDSRPGTSKQSVTYFDKDFEQLTLQWYEEANSDLSGNDEDDQCEESEHDSASTISLSDEESSEGGVEDLEGVESNNYFYGKNRFKWAKKAPSRFVRTPQHNIIVQLPGLRGEARAEDSATPEKVWSLLFDEEVIEELVICTNRKMRTMSGQYNDETRTEMKIYSAVFKSNHEDVRLLFATDGTGRDIFRAVMSRERFTVLLASLRFDNPDDRNERQKTEPTAAISNVFQKFFKNSQKVYSLGANVCVDEMLIGFRGRCKFKMFMPQKPAKYGIKLMLLTDARTAYAYNGYIYSGKNSDGVELTQSESKFAKPTQAVLRLSKPIHGTNRNITADNWFSSIELVNTLKERKLTFVGTLKKNKREIPREFLPSRSKPQGSTMYGFTKECTILSYVTKKNKAVLLVSSMHHGESNGPSGKPVIIEYYNNTKGGVDALDEKCAVYSCGRRTQRWSMAVFYRILDMSTVNAYVLYGSYKNNPPLSRSDFMKNLARSLVDENMRRRANNYRNPCELRTLIGRILKIDIVRPNEEAGLLEKRKYCYLCPSKLHRKTKYVCTECRKPICLECSKKLCKTCVEKKD